MLSNIHCMQDGADIDKFIGESCIVTPFIIQVGRPGLLQFLLVAEKQLYVEVDSLLKAMNALMALFFVFDIAYPRQCENTLLFLEKKIFQISGKQKFGHSALCIITDIENVIV